jgi:hypothetical protein
MKIDTSKVNAARAVLKAINKRLLKVKTTENYLYLNHYQNCREQGFIIINRSNGKTRWVAFSENRNSDDIVVYPSTGEVVPMQGVSNKSWESRVFFKLDEADKAAAFCVDYLF